MLEPEYLRAEGEKHFSRDLLLELEGLKERLRLSEAELGHIQILAQWAYNSGFHTGMSCGRQLSFNDRLKVQ
ncbi:hypothetical protein [Cohnella fermenti]|uniref:Uncharacterized protein n=1 Tax=Cohnella fermenti TaxID=2565925 RepID=A0A4V3WE69_9BACL|nr:hypothetical protein [Cohnella fermenti]THF75044.1 hypothetical protein E6C55_23345 [Cohnella fermenti]